MEPPEVQKMLQNAVRNGGRADLFIYSYANVLFLGRRGGLLLCLQQAHTGINQDFYKFSHLKPQCERNVSV